MTKAQIQADNPPAAIAVGNRIKKAIGLWVSFPGLGRPAGIKKTRVLLVAATPYAVYYTVNTVFAFIGR